jgi:hypothetical protein
MDFYVVLERAGYRVARRRRCKNKVGHQHKLTKEDAMKWFQQKFEGIILVRPARAPPRPGMHVYRTVTDSASRLHPSRTRPTAHRGLG